MIPNLLPKARSSKMVSTCDCVVERGSYCMAFVSFLLMWPAYLVVVVVVDRSVYLLALLPTNIDMLYSTLQMYTNVLSQ